MHEDIYVSLKKYFRTFLVYTIECLQQNVTPFSEKNYQILYEHITVIRKLIYILYLIRCEHLYGILFN